MVRLQKRFAYRYKDRMHYKYVLTIPTEAIAKLGLKEGDDLKPIVSDGKLILKPSKLQGEKR